MTTAGTVTTGVGSSGVAERIIGAVAPTTVLDVGCAKGMLVQALREKGVAAEGFLAHLSDDAIDSAHPDARPHLRVASATDPIEGQVVAGDLHRGA